MCMEGGSTEEARILKLTERVNSALSALRAKLEASFENLPSPPQDDKVTERAQHSNVLDDIADNLRQALNRVESLEAFVTDKVIKKIH